MLWKNNQIPVNDTVRSLAASLSARTPFPLPLANILVQKGIDTFEQAKFFFAPGKPDLHDPFLMLGMDRATQRILAAIQREEKILIYGDYDVDGTTSVSVLQLFFRDLGLNYEHYIPDRYTEGYGVSFKGIEYAKENQHSLIISLDCGIKAIDKVKHAKLAGIDFIICDHHTPGETLPEAVAILNPKQVDCPYPYKELPGAGVALKLIQALTETLKTNSSFHSILEDYDPFEEFCDLVTLSIACDIVPITGENRLIAFHGLKKLQSNPQKGLRALMDLAEDGRDWNITDLVFFLGPRINSAGRMGHADAAVRLLTGESEDLSAFAEELHASNHDRKETDKQITHEALAVIQSNPVETQKRTTVLFNEKWHKGVIGIVASRLIEKHYRPTILLTKSDNNWVGSGRSVPGFDLYAALEACSEHIVQFGGHKYAAGLTIKGDQIDLFREKFESVVAASITEEQLTPVLQIAHEIEFSYLDTKFLRLLNRFAPFGPGNREPVFMSRNVKVKDVRILKEEHVRLVLEQGGIAFEAIGFGLAEKWSEVNSLNVDVAYQAGFKTWKGVTSIQLRIKDLIRSA